jgi:uncharacterized membrane protein
VVKPRRAVAMWVAILRAFGHAPALPSVDHVLAVDGFHPVIFALLSWPFLSERRVKVNVILVTT